MSEFLSTLLKINKKYNRPSSTQVDTHTCVTLIGHAVDERRLLLHAASKCSTRNHWYTTSGLNRCIRKKSKMHANAYAIQSEGIKQHMVARAPKRLSGDSEGHYLLFNSAHVKNPFLLAQIVPKIMCYTRIKTPTRSHQPRAAIEHFRITSQRTNSLQTNR